MDGTLVAAQPKRRLPRRIKVGIWVTVGSLVILLYPGQMELPLMALTPLMPRMGGCANFLAPVVFMLFFGVGFLLSVTILIIGIVAVVLAATGRRAGLVLAVLFNAVVISLLLIPPLDPSPGPDQGQLGLFALLAVCALVPIAAIVLLLTPSAFRSLRLFVATALVAVLLLVPAAVGGVTFGLELAGGAVSQPANSPTNGTPHAC